MATPRKLRLPDGGSVNLEIPDGFGDPLAGISESPPDDGWLLLLGAGVGAIVVWALLKVKRA